MKAETYRRKAEELREKAANTNPRFWRKIEEMEAEADRLEEKAAEKEAEEAESESDEDEDWDDEDDVCDWEDDDDEESEEEDDDFELPKIFSSYHKWKIWIDKDEGHKYVVTAVLENDDGYEIDRFEIYGDEIAEDADIETVVEEEIDDRDEQRKEAEDFNKNYHRYMGLDEDPDWDESNDPD